MKVSLFFFVFSLSSGLRYGLTCICWTSLDGRLQFLCYCFFPKNKPSSFFQVEKGTPQTAIENWKKTNIYKFASISQKKTSRIPEFGDFWSFFRNYIIILEEFCKLRDLSDRRTFRSESFPNFLQEYTFLLLFFPIRMEREKILSCLTIFTQMSSTKQSNNLADEAYLEIIAKLPNFWHQAKQFVFWGRSTQIAKWLQLYGTEGIYPYFFLTFCLLHIKRPKGEFFYKERVCLWHFMKTMTDLTNEVCYESKKKSSILGKKCI